MRGSTSDRWRIVDDGMLLYSALPHKEVSPKSWQGPSPNVKMQLQRAFPDKGAVRMRVTASKGYFPDNMKAGFVKVPKLAPAVKAVDPKQTRGGQIIASEALPL